MPAGFLGTFSPNVRLWDSVVQRGIREGLSGEAILRAGFAGGLIGRRQDLLRLIRLERGVEEVSSQLRFTRLDRRPDPLKLKEAGGKIRRFFAFILEVKGRSVLTGELASRHVTISTDSLLTRGELEEAALETLEEDTYAEEFEGESAILVRGVRAGAAGVL